MKISDRFQMALRNLVRRKSRTVLTVLSVVIGASSIILMIAFALGINQQQKDMVESFGGLTSITILTENNGGSTKVDQASISRLQSIDGVKVVVPFKSFYSEIKIEGEDDYSLDSQIQVMPDDVIDKLTGDMFSSGSKMARSEDNKIILGSEVKPMKMVREGGGGYSGEPVEDFDYSGHKYFIRLGWQDENDDGVNFGNENQENGEEKKPTYADIPVEISGTLNSKSFVMGWSSVINESLYKKLQKEDKKLESPQLNQNFGPDGKPVEVKNDGQISYDNLNVVVEDVEKLEDVEAAIRKAGFQTQSSAGSAEEIKKTSMIVTLILGGIGSVAFIVSAIGIINTMLMSIYERQKEIGVMKVIGASINDIRSMFLIESGFIGFFGGIVGLIISLLIGSLINKLAQGSGIFMGGGEDAKILLIPIWLALVGVGFSSMVGVLAGYIPARRATKLSAIEALRAN